MKPNAECSDCTRWWNDYEAATMEEFRAHSRLQIARYSHDEQAIAGLVAEAESVTRHRDCLRAALLEHQKSHSPAKAA